MMPPRGSFAEPPHDVRAELGYGEVSAAHHYRGVAEWRVHAHDARVAGDGGCTVLQTCVLDRVFRRVAVCTQREAQSAAALRGERRVQPAEIGKGERRSSEMHRDAAPVETDAPSPRYP